MTSQQAISDPAVFDGAFDVGLFSRWPIVHSEYRELSSYFVRASVLHARVLMPGFAPVDAFCTHLGSPLGVIPYRGKYGSWEGEHLQQVKEILEFVREKSNDDRPLLLLGDFNMGPKTAFSDPVWERHYWMTIGAGLDNAYLSGGSARCTSCAGTTFRDSSATNQLIDHVFSMGLSTRNSKWERLFDVPVAITHDVPAFNLSDHTGLRVTFSRSDQH
ncbi:MAG TPA: endonuclease/exonuclease/phosphatase family protein [Polyangiaceae bacterium]|nr:endonuclease/exonuclease/phosphatase family protein [Polyangiaceae bacterium]